MFSGSILSFSLTLEAAAKNVWEGTQDKEGNNQSFV